MKPQTQTLYVYLDCSLSDTPQFLGQLYREVLRGVPKYAFEFDKQWLKDHANIRLSADLENFSGRQYVPRDADMFGCFSDAMPDRWGRLLMNRREQLDAQKQNRPPKTLTAFDLLSGVDDYSRIGGFRFKTDPDGPFLNEEGILSVPPLTELRVLMQSAQAIEDSELNNCLPEEKCLLQLLKPGSSLGGARPKATVRDENGDLWIAKFPSRSDDHDLEAWEQFAYLMARKAGITTAETKLLDINEQSHILLIKRFDRKGSKRTHFASSMTLLGLKDGDGAATGYGYLDMAGTIVENCVEVERNLEELFRRVAFNICIGNTDDHFRNHGFLLMKKGWTLSPAYDLNPTTNRYQSLLINDYSASSSIDVLRKSAKDYFLSQETVDNILSEVVTAMKDWERIAKCMKLSQRDIDIFASRFITSYE